MKLISYHRFIDFGLRRLKFGVEKIHNPFNRVERLKVKD